MAVALLMGPATGFADWRTFTSSDGSRTLEAEMISYDESNGAVMLRLKNRQTIKAPATAFSSEDQTFIAKTHLAMQAGRMLMLEFADTEKEISEKKNPVGGFQTVKLKNGFEVRIRNNHSETFQKLDADYRIYFSSFGDPFADGAKRSDKVHAGNMEIESLSPRDEISFTTEEVDLTEVRRLRKTECIGGT